MAIIKVFSDDHQTIPLYLKEINLFNKFTYTSKQSS